MITSRVQAQVPQYSGSNHVVFKLRSGETDLNLQSSNLLASYESSVGYFKLVVPFDDLTLVKGMGTDSKMLRQLKKHMKGKSVVFWIYIEDRPLALDNFEGLGKILPVRVEFGPLSFQNEIRLWGKVINDSMILRIKANHQFNPPVKMNSKSRFSIDLLQIFSEHIEIYNFIDLLN